MTIPTEEQPVGYSGRKRGATGPRSQSHLVPKLYDNGVQHSPLPLVFRQSEQGGEPVREWLDDLDRADKKVMGRDISKVQFGWPVDLPLCRALSDELWEVRSSLPSKREARVLICFRQGVLVALHAFFKSTQTTPRAELTLARQR